MALLAAVFGEFLAALIFVVLTDAAILFGGFICKPRTGTVPKPVNAHRCGSLQQFLLV